VRGPDTNQKFQVTESIFVNAKLIELLKKGYASQQQGNLAAAENSYRRVLKYDANNAMALNLMGVVCLRRSRLREASRFLLKALSVSPSDAETHLNLGLAYIGLKELSKAQKAFENSLNLNRNHPVAWYNLGNVMMAMGRQDQAINCYESALALWPDYFDCLNNLSAALKEVGRLEHALQVIERAIRIDGSRSMLHDNKGLVLMKAGRYEEARMAFEQAVSLGGGNVSRINLSTALKQTGEQQAAVEILQGVLKEDADNAEAHSQLGILQVQLGDTEFAAQHLRRALELSPGHVNALYELSKMRNQHLSDDEVSRIRTLLEDVRQPNTARALLYFALAFEHEKREEFDTSFNFLLQGQEIKASRNQYDGDARTEYLSVSRQVFPVELKDVKRTSSDLPVPLFVVGMPRSGTTLVEQIISTHSAVTDGGEAGFVHELAEQTWAMTQEKYPFSMNRINAEQARELRDIYLEKMVERCGHNRFLVDKNPQNFNFIGLIATVFPEARILHCKRDPLDNCVSIFRLPFEEEHAYSHDLAALGHYYRIHLELMDFWKTCYPEQILTVGYEDLVGDLEQQARRMLEFIGVEFEQQVLSFFENERIVLTPSADQVRQPVYDSRIRFWKNYEKHLGPLVESLEGVI
jgi:tetratricopeptide (TPR) repeat protein